MAGKESTGTGDPQAKVEANILIVEARYYEDIGEALMRGAVAELTSHGSTFEVISVPGALEIPQVVTLAIGNEMTALNGLTAERPYDGIIALGCVVRGETAHYDIVCNNANHWLMEAVTSCSVPFGNAILTVDTKAQAMARASCERNGKGGDAVRACLRLIEISRKFDEIGIAALELDDVDLIEGTT